jgi:hypothetical protein
MSLPNNKLTIITDNPICANGAVENSDASYSTSVVSGGLLTLPDSQINVNSVDSGDVVSVKTIDVNLEDSLGAPVVPTSVGLVGNTLTIEVPSGGGSYDIDTTDRFGNVLPTIIVSADTTLNWNSYDFADVYLNRLVNPPTGAQLTALYTFFDDLITAGVFQKATSIHPIIGGTADDHKWNARYPYDKSNSPNLKYFGSPTHNANGISTNGTTNLIQTCFMPKNLPLNNKQVSIYKRNQTFNPAANQMYFQAGTNNPKAFSLFHLTNNTLGLYTDSTFFQTTAITAAESQGLISLRRNAASGTNAQSLLRNGTILRSSTTAFQAETDAEINIGGGLSATNTIENGCPLHCSYVYIGEALTSTQETDHYNIVQAIQTAFSRNV